MNKNWYIVVDQYTEYKELEFYCTRSDFAEPMCKKFSKWKNNGKRVTETKQDNAWENKVVIKLPMTQNGS